MWANHILLEIHEAGWKHKSNKEQFGRHFQKQSFYFFYYVARILFGFLRQQEKELQLGRFQFHSSHHFERHNHCSATHIIQQQQQQLYFTWHFA